LAFVQKGLLLGQSNYNCDLQTLNEVFNKRYLYENEKIARIDSLELLLKYEDISDEEKYNYCKQLYSEYQFYNYDKAYFYTEQMLDLAEKTGDKDKIINAKLSMAYSCLNAGLFKESSEILLAIDEDQLDVHQKIVLYSFLSKLYLDMSASIGVEPYQSKYNKKSVIYSQFIIDLLGEDNPQSIPHKVNIYRCRQQYREAIEITKMQLETISLDKRSKSLYVGGLALFYLQLKDTANAIPCLCYAAVADIQAVIKETPALRILASIIYSKGDLHQSYKYATAALEDAEFFNARHRKIEIGSVLPIIEETRFDLVNKQRQSLIKYSLIISMLFLLLLVATIIIFKQMKQLRYTRKINQQQNEELKQVNQKLHEVDNIKNRYIGQSFNINSKFIDKLEEYRKLVTRKIIGKQYDDLLNILKNTEIQKEREEMFYSFDQTFMKIFPNFVEQFNLLLKEEYRIKANQDNRLSPEIRIFALIRLGVSDVENIAKFLNYSVHTIYAYKSKIKTRSTVPSEQFEQEIMKIKLTI
jgi:hypothetical protein